jgi:agmatine deiminase
MSGSINAIFDKSPAAAGFRQPAEWALHSACWTAFPSHEEAWYEFLEQAQEEFCNMCKAISEHGGEILNILVPNQTLLAKAKVKLEGVNCNFIEMPFGDVWLRDTAPIFLKDTQGNRATVRFRFNGWGKKYVMEHDDKVGAAIASLVKLREFSVPIVMEGGSIDVDGEGTCLTTEQCLLNRNRNPGLSKEVIIKAVKDSFGVEKILWLGDGLLNDHTDGHIDNIARFISPGRVVCMEAREQDDPNKKILENVYKQLASFTDAKNRTLEIISLPSVGIILDKDGKYMPASYMNFYIASKAVIVPIFGSPYDNEAISILESCFPHRKVIGVRANGILTGGGSFHCITQQQPI